VLERSEQEPLFLEPAIDGELHGMVIAGEIRKTDSTRIRQYSVFGNVGRPIEEFDYLVVGGSRDVVRATVIEDEWNGIGEGTAQIDLSPVVPAVLVDVGGTDGETFGQLVFEVRRGLVTVGVLEIAVDAHEARPP
jgi:hypothetical protein